MIAMPGFINGHLHLWQTALRGIAATGRSTTISAC